MGIQISDALLSYENEESAILTGTTSKKRRDKTR
jgi:hypothetical protein